MASDEKSIRLTLDGYDKSMLDFVIKYNQLHPDHCILTLMRFVLSLTATSAAGESSFSLAGLLDTPHRNRMTPDTPSKLTVIKWFLAKNDPTTVVSKIKEYCRSNESFF